MSMSSTKNLLTTNLPRVSPMREEILWQKIPRVRKVSSVPNQEEKTRCSLVIQETPVVELARRPKTTRARGRIKAKKCVDGIARSTKFGVLITSDHNILDVENESRRGQKTLQSCKMTSRIGFRAIRWKRKKNRRQCRVYKDFFLLHRSWK